MVSVVIFGYGNVGQQLVRAFRDAGSVELVQVYNRKLVDDPRLIEDGLYTNDLSKIADADVYLITIPDDAIAGFSEELPFKGKLVVHTSGSVPMKALSEQNRRGVFYPLQTFTKGRPVDFSEIPICIEAEKDKDLKKLESLGKAISDKVQVIDSKQREQLHLAAVVVNNFVNHLFFMAEELLADKGLEFDLLKPLIRESVDKLEVLSVSDAQTGPARRNDLKTIKNHLNLLQHKEHRKLYKLLTKAIQRTYGEKL